MTADPDAVGALRGEEPVNVFMLDHDPAAAARAHCDRHVVKMIVETAQLLSTAWHRLHNADCFPVDAEVPYSGMLEWVVPPALFRTPQLIATRKDGPVYSGDKPFWLLAGQRVYNPTHAHHPCAVWARSLGGNYLWLWRLGMALLDEYTARYGRVHKTAPVLWTLEAVPPALWGSLDTWSEVPPAMPEDSRVLTEDGFYDSVQSYRTYYVKHKQALLTWKGSAPPAWLTPTEGGTYTLAD